MSAAGEWLAQQLWQLFPFVLAAAFLAVSLAAAGGVYLLLTRTISVRRSAAIPGAVLFASVVLIALVVTWSIGVLVPASGPESFEAAAWQSQPWTRWGMAHDLVASDRLLGVEREEVVSLLDYGDGSYTPEGVDPRDVDAWQLYRPQDVLHAHIARARGRLRRWTSGSCMDRAWNDRLSMAPARRGDAR